MNIKALVTHAFANGMAKSEDEAKVLLIISAKCDEGLNELGDISEDSNGDDVSGSD